MKLVVWATAVGVIVLGFLIPYATVQAQQVQLNQIINPIDCTLTELSNGNGTVLDSDCPAQAAQVDGVSMVDGRPIIFGKYDAANAAVFRVKCRGIWYTLGSNVELTANGNLWRLDLQSEDEFEPGTYELILEMTTFDDQVIIENTSIVIPGNMPDPPTGVTTPLPEKQGILAPNTGLFGLLSYGMIPSLIFAVIVASIVTSLAYILYHQYRRKP